jgi:putative membrane protein
MSGNRTRAGAPSRELRWSPLRLTTAGVLAAWAALFWFLLISGRSSLYLSERTDWVVPLGAVILSCAAVGRAVSGRVREPTGIGSKQAWGLGVIVVPVVAVLALPPSALGSYAASRRSSFTGAGFAASAEDISSGRLTLVDVVGAQRDAQAMRALAQRAGSEVNFTGFVTHDKGSPADEFVLTRFVVSCCVADALAVQVRVINAPPGKFKADDWVLVTGAIYPLGSEVVVQASSVTAVDRPAEPYLSP